MAMSARSALGEALEDVDGDASNKDKLAEAMTKVQVQRAARAVPLRSGDA